MLSRILRSVRLAILVDVEEFCTADLQAQWRLWWTVQDSVEGDVSA